MKQLDRWENEFLPQVQLDITDVSIGGTGVLGIVGGARKCPLGNNEGMGGDRYIFIG